VSGLATKHDIETSRLATRSDLGEFRVFLYSQVLEWSFRFLFAALITSYASLCFLVIHYLQK
jgi:hypothetical protein